MPKKKNLQCLMIETTDHRQFFTSEKNYLQLIEFSKAFGAEISVVKVKEAEVLDLKQLAPAICNNGYKPSTTPQYDIIEKKIEQQRDSRKESLRKADVIRNYIRKQFASGKIVKLKDVKKRYARYELSPSAFSNHLALVRHQMIKGGYKIKKLAPGEYRVV